MGLPTGTVTFLFTDIENSTRRWQEQPSMASDLARHDAIIAATVREHEGHLVKHTGDGAMAAFERPGAALAAAVEAQERLRGSAWEGEPLRVRMAIHTGEAEERDGDYFGPTPTLTARIMDAGHGGQVLTTPSTEQLVRDRSSRDLSFLDLGEYVLKGLERPQRILQVTIVGQERAFRPLRAARAHDGLPRPRTSFVGRSSEIEQIQRQLRRHSLVTLTGAGGSGKTRLAVETARRLRTNHRDGVHFVDLAPVGDPDQVASTVGAAVGLPSGHRASSLAEVVAELLSTRDALLVLDNCEHLVEAVAELVDRILSRAPALHVLATSRQPLEVEGEVTFTVPLLDPAGDAVQLFADRAAAVQPTFDIDDGHRPAVEEICAHLDGMPLAIELAAARVQMLSPNEIVQRLDDRFRLLTSGGRRRARHQQTLRAVLDWSHDLLEDEQRALFRRLSVFVGGFTLAAVEDVCCSDLQGSTIDLLGDLVSKSLVEVDVQDTGSRFRLLETMRLYAHDQLRASGEPAALRGAHREWFLTRVESSADNPLAALSSESEFDADVGNLRRAVEWSIDEARWDLVVRLLTASIRTWARPGRAEDALAWLEAAARDRRLDASLRFRAHAAASWFATLTTDYASMGEHAARALELEPEPNAEEAPWVACGLFSSMMWALFNDLDQAERHILRALDIVRHHGLEESECRYRLGLLRVTQERYEEAAGEFDAVMELVGPKAVWAATEAVIVHHLLDRHARAADLAEGLPVPEQMSDPSLAVVIQTAVAIGDLSCDRPDRARRRLVDALAQARRDQVPLGAERCLVSLAYVEALHGAATRAALVLGRATNADGLPFRTPADVAVYRRTVSLLRSALTRTKRHRLRAKGRELDLDDVADLVTTAI